MERTVNETLLRSLLNDSAVLPSAEELTQLMIQAEFNGLVVEGQREIAPDLLESVGWFLLGAAASPSAEDYYGAGLRRQAFQVAGHLLDLTLRTSPGTADPLVRARLCFASQVAYLRGSHHPNAAAIFRKAYPEGHEWPSLLANAPLCCLHLGMLLLAGRTRDVQRAVKTGVREVRTLENRWGITPLTPTWLGSASHVIFGVRRLTRFQLSGLLEALDDARRLFRSALEEANGDSLSKWVASHLLELSEDLLQSSPWTVLPPDVPHEVVRAFTDSDSPVLTLWPPQVEFLQGQQGKLFDAETRRLFLASPTSAGKTLIAQLLVAVHLGRGGKGACFVVPTRSLSAEVSQGLRRRLERLGAVVHQSDVLTPDIPLGDADVGQRHLVSVITPEKLSYLLHRDPQGVLDAFDLFVFDEVHNLNNEKRGWLLESLITYLHAVTSNSDHKILLMSAAIGNQNHFLEWLRTDDVPYSNQNAVHADWRAPRRLTTVYRTRKGAQLNTVAMRGGREERTSVSLDGVLISPLFDAIGQEVLVENVGEQVFRHPQGQISTDENARVSNTPHYLTAVPLVHQLMRHGLVLVVIQRKSYVEKFAVTLAERLPAAPQTARITALMEEVRRTLGEEHPLLETLAKGIAFHHADVPSDLRLNIEREAGAGSIQCVVCTTSLTEGVNLPVRSVVIAERYRYENGIGYVPTLSPSQILNALGRAGRAAIETEGLLVLVAGSIRQSDRRILEQAQPSPEELMIRSTLADASALQAFQALEAQLAHDERVLFTTSDERGDGFITFVWWLAARYEGHEEKVLEVLTKTIAAQQLSPTHFDVLHRLTRQILHTYDRTDPVARRRWATSSTSLGTSYLLDQLAEQIKNDPILDLAEGPEFIIQVLDLMLPELLGVKEVQRALGPQRLGWPHQEWLRIWLAGGGTQDLLRDHQIPNLNVTKIQSYVYDLFEFTLPWVVSSLLERVTMHDDATCITVEHIPALTALIRLGLPSVTMVPPVREGVLSRTLAVRLWHAAGATSMSQEEVKDWLRGRPVEEWDALLELTAYELESLLRFASVSIDIQNDGLRRIARVEVPGFHPEQGFEVEHTDLLGVPTVHLIQEGVRLPVPPSLLTGVMRLLAMGYDFVEWNGKLALLQDLEEET